MPNHHSAPLFHLIKTLSKAEKRNFRMYVNRGSGSDVVLFVQLFNVLDKQKEYDEEIIFKRIPSIKRQQLSNLKRHLYKQLLTSLRLIETQKNIDLQIREQIDFARILYNKGLYLQSLKILDKVKSVASEFHQDILELEIIEFEKLIESRHITRSIENRADELAMESDLRNQIIGSTSRLSNLALRLYGLYIEMGHARNKKDFEMVKVFFEANLPEVDPSRLTFFEKIYYYQSHVWYYYIRQNFTQCFKYAQKWVLLFQEYPDMLRKDPDLYLRGLNNLLASLFYTRSYERMSETLKQFHDFDQEYHKYFSKNTETYSFLFYYTGMINKHFIEGTFTEGVKHAPEMDRKLHSFEQHLDSHRVLVFYYKLACLYFGSGDNDTAIEYLNRIINFKAGSLRGDIQCFARLLNLIAHYELGHFNLLEYLVKSVYRFLTKMENLNLVQQEILQFLRRSLNSTNESLETAFVELKDRLEPLSTHPYEGRSFLYLDFISWLECKIQNRSVEEVIREKFLRRKGA